MGKRDWFWGILSMDMSYGFFLERLKEERKNKNLTQSQVGAELRMSQSHYSKAEQGNRRFTFFEMQSLCETELDAFYILTGIKADGKYKGILEQKSYHELTFLMRVVCYADEYRKRKEMFFFVDNSWNGIDLERYALNRDRQNNILYSLRRMKNFSQKKMSEFLEVDVKKIRDMEKGIALPDSELIMRIHYMFSVPFSVILKEKNLLVSELCYMLGSLEKNTSKEMFGLIQDCVSLME